MLTSSGQHWEEKSGKSDFDTALYNKKMLTAKIRSFWFFENCFYLIFKIKNYKIFFLRLMSAKRNAKHQLSPD